MTGLDFFPHLNLHFQHEDKMKLYEFLLHIKNKKMRFAYRSHFWVNNAI